MVVMVVTTSSINAIWLTPSSRAGRLTVKAAHRLAFLAEAEVIDVCGSVFRTFARVECEQGM